MKPVKKLSERELAGRAGATVEQVRELTELGVLESTAEAAYRPSDIQRVRIVQALGRAGIPPSLLGRLIHAGTYSMAWAELRRSPRQGTRRRGLCSRSPTRPTGMVGRLGFDSLVERRSDPGDARASLILLAARSRRLSRWPPPSSPELDRLAQARLGPHEAAELKAALAQLIDLA